MQPRSLEVRTVVAYLGYLLPRFTPGLLSFELLNLTREPAPLAVSVGLGIRVSRPFGCVGVHGNINTNETGASSDLLSYCKSSCDLVEP